MALDALEQRITDILVKRGISPYIIEFYLEDIFAYSDKALYESSTDEDIIKDFEDWLEE